MIGADIEGGSFSLAIYRKEPILFTGGKFNASEMTSTPPEKITYLPDFEGVRLTGNITDASGIAVAEQKVILSYPGSGTDIVSTTTNSEGVFNFLLKPDEGNRDVVFTLPSANLRMNLEESFWNGFRNPPSPAKLRFDDEAVEFLKERYALIQLQRRFKQHDYTRTDSTDILQENDAWRFYSKPDQLMKSSDYIRLDSLTEYFWELLPSAKFIRKKNEYNVYVIDPVSYLPFKDPPAVFVDGVLYSDYQQLAEMPVDDLGEIAIVDNIYYYRDFTFGGIIDIHTKKSNFNAVKIQPDMVRVLYPLGSPSEMTYTSPLYPLHDRESKIPDLRYLLCWNPDITVPLGRKDIAVEFYTSDVEGEYIVSVVGLTGNGKIVQYKSNFTVKATP